MVVWIVLPPPNRFFWLWSIGVGEWSLWFGAAALIYIAAAIGIRIYEGHGWLWVPTVIFGVAAFAITLYPLLTVRPLARKHGAPLSLLRYFDGFPAADYIFGSRNKHFTTHTFCESGLELDVYLPTVQNENNGASVIVVHGGSWSGGRRSDFPRWNRWLCAQGFAVFDIDYTLAIPNYLTAPADIKAVIRWVKDHAAEFEISPERIALLGRSAGAHLAMLAAYTANETESVRAVASFYGPVDLLWAYDIRGNKRVHDGPQSLINHVGGRPEDSEEIRARYISASPITYVSTKTPPTFMTHGGRDRLVWWKNMERLGTKLSAADVTHEIHLIPYAQHGFDFNENGWGSQVIKTLVLKFLVIHTAPKF